MQIKQFTASTVAAAAAQARREMGPDAVVLQSRKVPAPGLRRLMRRFDRIQLTMAVDEGIERPPRRPYKPEGQPAPAVEGLRPGVRAEGHGPAPAVAGPGPRRGAAASGSPGPTAAAPATKRPAVAPAGPAAGQPGNRMASGLLLAESSDQEAARSRLRRVQVSGGPDLGPPQPIRPRAGVRTVVVLVGPTGAGKTTTAGKLAATLHLDQGWRVALVTADTFRVGAVEQLSAYARLLSLPLEVAATPRALQRVIGRLADSDVILVDTAGRGHRDDQRMHDLAAFVDAAGEAAGGVAPEVQLVLPATAGAPQTQAVIGAYRAAGANRLLLTKLDECEDPAQLAEAAAAARLPLSYWCAGQRVPEDIAIAWPDELLAWADAAGRAS